MEIITSALQAFWGASNKLSRKPLHLVAEIVGIEALQPSLQPIAFIAAFISVLSFLLLAWSSGGYNTLVGRVVTADLVALVALVIGAAAYVMNTNH